MNHNVEMCGSKIKMNIVAINGMKTQLSKLFSVFLGVELQLP
jgi:hypothetical protein